MPQHIAVIDVGKTNKKVIIFDDKLTIVESAYQSFDEKIDGILHLELVEEASAWIMKQLGDFASKYDIRAISITTHGATAIAIGKDGKIAAPPIAYTTDAGEDFDQQFFDEFGTQEDLQEETCTAKIGSMINIAKVVYYIKKTFPDKFAAIDKILNYPQYFGYLFTGNAGAEPTFLGCHTYLYNHRENKYSSVAEKLGILDKLPPQISKSWEVLGTVTPEVSEKTGLSTECIVTMGIHDSNSSLLPYLVKGYDNFALNSTGTWCVAMHPTKGISFEREELGKLVFFNLDAFFNPVKTSIFMGGLEFQTYTDLLKEINGVSDYPSFNRAACEKVVADKSFYILPSVVKGTGIYPDALPRVVENGEIFSLEEIQSKSRIPEFFRDFETAFAAVAISLAIQTKAALNMAGYEGAGTIFTEGGFRKNQTYNALLTALFPESQATLTGLNEATAFGAAILAKAALDGTTPMEAADTFEIEITEVPRVSIAGMNEYVEEFNRLVNEA